MTECVAVKGVSRQQIDVITKPYLRPTRTRCGVDQGGAFFIEKINKTLLLRDKLIDLGSLAFEERCDSLLFTRRWQRDRFVQIARAVQILDPGALLE